MAQKCVHKGCGKLYTDLEEDCVYHPGPPVFHEGQKGTCGVLLNVSTFLPESIPNVSEISDMNLTDLARVEMLQTPRSNLRRVHDNPALYNRQALHNRHPTPR